MGSSSVRMTLGVYSLDLRSEIVGIMVTFSISLDKCARYCCRGTVEVALLV